MIGGLDPTGGGGLLRDGWTIDARAPLLRVRAIATALTLQGAGSPASVFPVPATQLRSELQRVASVRVIKLGLVANAQLDALTSELHRLRGTGASVVLDPILAASDGGRIGADPSMLSSLARFADLLTPNLAELERLGAYGPIPCPMLIKGERIEPDRIRDRLVQLTGADHHFERHRLSTPDPRGTGCTLATAIACELATGATIVDACERAIAWLDQARQHVHLGRDGRWQLDRGPFRSGPRP